MMKSETITVSGVDLTIITDPDMPEGVIRVGSKPKPKSVQVWTKRHISGIVWVVSIDAKLEVDTIYKVRDNNFPTPHLKVKYEGFRKPDSMPCYIVVELNNYFPDD